MSIEPKKPPARQRILETAERLFYTQGYRATGINQIIAEASVAKASLYQHFPSKESLALAYLQKRRQRSFDELQAMVDSAPDPREKVSAVFQYSEKVSLSENFRGCAFSNIASEIADSQSVLAAEVAGHKKAVLSLLRDIVSQMERPAQDHEQLARSLYILFEGALTACRNQGEKWPVQAAQTAAQKMLEQPKHEK